MQDERARSSRAGLGRLDGRDEEGVVARLELMRHAAAQPTGRTGEQYRITAPGPGVTPDVMWQGAGLHAYDRHNPADVSLEQQMNAERDQIRAGYGKCAHT